MGKLVHNNINIKIKGEKVMMTAKVNEERVKAFDAFKKTPEYKTFEKMSVNTFKAHDDLLDAMKKAITDNELSPATAEYAILTASIDMVDLIQRFKGIEDKAKRVEMVKKIIATVIKYNFEEEAE